MERNDQKADTSHWQPNQFLRVGGQSKWNYLWACLPARVGRRSWSPSPGKQRNVEGPERTIRKALKDWTVVWSDGGIYEGRVGGWPSGQR